ncbi:MAG TPA: Stf0 family sulfotransferase [Parafilimonas sp.]|nr:Stf0 family sulfotransferase [Parafilimonas sp.]
MTGNSAKQDFFILTAPRSGSTVLVQTLDKHSQIFCAGELFHHSNKIYHPEWHYPFWGVKKKKGFSRLIFSTANYIKVYLSGVSHIKKFYAGRDEKDVRGFKLMISHVKDFPTVWKYLNGNDFKMIVLLRKNSFRAALSSFRGKQIGIFHTSEDLRLAEKKVEINAASLKKRVDELEEIKTEILRLSEGKNRIIIWYEDFENRQPMLNKIFDFLSVEKLNVSSELVKTSKADWREGVNNYQEVEDVMKEKYSHYI